VKIRKLKQKKYNRSPDRITICNLDNDLYIEAQIAAKRARVPVGVWISQVISEKLNVKK
jgi:hypothetical protein